jgi:serine protease inhibitor
MGYAFSSGAIMTRCFLCLGLLLSTFPVLAQVQSKPSYESIVSANNQFAIKLLKKSFSTEKPANVITSPAAISSTLSWVMAGASEPARSEIQKALELDGLHSDEINLQNRALLKAHPPTKGRAEKRLNLAKVPKSERWIEQYRSSGKMPRGYFRTVGLWTEKHSYLEPRMRYLASEFYGVEQVAFPTNWSAANLDQWITERLMGAPERLGLPQRKYGVRKFTSAEFKHIPVQDFKLIDASLFNCEWHWHGGFDALTTKPAEFHTNDSQSKTVPMMSRGGWMAYGESDEYQAVRLGYEQQYSLYVVLPSKTKRLAAFLEAFDKNQLVTFEKSLAFRPGSLRLPKFNIDGSQNATPALRKLGINSAFERWDNLPGFSPEGAKLVDVQVRNRMKIDERGTTLINVVEMSGGVIGGIPGGTPSPGVPFEMVVDRPFLFYVADDLTKEVLFLGAVVEP